MKKYDTLHNLYIEAITMDGFCLSKVNGLIVFLRGGAPGDTVSAMVTKAKKTFLVGRVLEVQKKSPHREDPFCTHFGLCGGCVWQHVNYTTQLHYKQQFVYDSLARIGGLPNVKVLPIIPCSTTKTYRNRLDFTFTAHRWLTREEMLLNVEKTPGLGFHLPRMFDKIFDVQTCHLQAAPSNAIRLAIKKVACQACIPFFDLRSQQGFLRTLTIRTTLSGETMIILQVAYEQMKWIAMLLDMLSDQFPQLTSVNYVINTKRNDTFHDLDVITWKGNPYITEWVKKPEGKNSLQFRIGPQSFYQTNSEQAAQLYNTILEMAKLNGNQRVYDLYTGVGTIANFVAAKAREVIGLEYVATAVEDAKENARLNAIDNTHFFAGDIKDKLDESFLSRHGYPDVVITDPPRAGMHKKVCEALLKAAPTCIIYVSCNPATQARDLKILATQFDIDAVQPVDMFPHTNHVENVVRLTRR